MRAGTHIYLSFWCKSRCFSITKRQVMSGTQRDLLFRSIKRCFASKNHTWGLGPMETSNSDARHAVWHSENHRWGLGPIETCYSGPEVAVLHAQNHRGLGPKQTCKTGHKVAVLQEKNTDEGWNPYILVILVQITLFFNHKTTGYVWDSERLVIPVHKTLFCIQKPHMRPGTHGD